MSERMNDEFAGPWKLLKVELACAVLDAAAAQFERTQVVSFFVSLPLFLLTMLTLVTMLKRWVERAIDSFPSVVPPAAYWTAFVVVGLPFSFFIAFLTCCAPMLYRG